MQGLEEIELGDPAKGATGAVAASFLASTDGYGIFVRGVVDAGDGRVVEIAGQPPPNVPPAQNSTEEVASA